MLLHQFQMLLREAQSPNPKECVTSVANYPKNTLEIETNHASFISSPPITEKSKDMSTW